MSEREFIVTVPMPFTGESIVDGILVSWLVDPGDTVEKGQHVAEIETEKSVWEFEAPCAGVIVSLKAEAGDVVDVNAPLFEIRTTDQDVRHLAGPGQEDEGAAEEAESVATVGHSAERGTVSVSPRIRKLLRDAGLSEEQWPEVAAASEAGRITAESIERYMEGAESRVSVSDNGSRAAQQCFIAGIGTYAPKRIIGNDHFVEHFDDIDESYIEKVTGIRERRWVDGESTSEMAVLAAKEALRNARIEAADIDMIVLATTTPDMPLPASSCVVAEKLGCRDIPAFDLQAACSGWLYGLSVGRQYVQSGTYTNVLVIASETMSAFTDVTDRATGFLFGDGAGAAVLNGRDGGHLLSNVVMRTDTAGYDIIYRKAGGTIMPPRAMSSPRDEFWVMDGGRMFRSAVSGFSDVIEAVAVQENVPLGEISWFVPHQANQRILKTVAHRLKADDQRFFSNIRLMGNTSAASIPLALQDLQGQHQLSKGDRLLLCAVGAGLTSAGCLITW